MSKDPIPDRGWRGSAELWLNAAQDVLMENGVDAVKIMPLANMLKLSRTSFYWFFKDRGALLDALLDRWAAATTGPLVRATEEYAATQTEAMLTVISTFLSDRVFDTRLELAVRAWAQQDPEVLLRLQAADATRLAALKSLLTKWGHSVEDADIRARTIYLVQIGYISMRVEESLEERLARFPRYVHIYTGSIPTDEEMQRFMARVNAKTPTGFGVR